jgi:hypothetical protein
MKDLFCLTVLDFSPWYVDSLGIGHVARQKLMVGKVWQNRNAHFMMVEKHRKTGRGQA